MEIKIEYEYSHQFLEITDSGERKLQNVIKEEVTYLYKEVLEQELPVLVHVFVKYIAGSTLMLFDSGQSDSSHIFIEMGVFRVKDFLDHQETKKNDFHFWLLHELIHSVDVTALKNAINYLEDIEVNRSPGFDYSLLECPMKLLNLYRDEGVATLCAQLFARYPSEYAKDSGYENVIGYHHFFEFGKYFVKTLSAGKSKQIEGFRELAEVVYMPVSRLVLMSVLQKLGLVSADLYNSWRDRRLEKEEKVALLKTCVSLSMSQYIAGLMTVDWDGMNLIPVKQTLEMCACVQKRRDENKMSLYTLLVETQYPSATDFIEVLEDLVDSRKDDATIGESIRACRENPSALDASTVEMVGRLWNFYNQYKEGDFRTYATAARWVLDYYFYQEDMIRDDMAGIGRADDIALMTKMWNLIQYEVFTPYLKFELDDTGEGLLVTGMSRYQTDDEGYYIEPKVEVLGHVLYIPAYHVFEGKRYPVVGIKEGAFLGDSHIYALYIPETLVSIGQDAFTWRFYSLRSIVVDSRNPYYDCRQGCNAIIETATNKLIFSSSRTFIPYSVTAIGPRALENARGKKDNDGYMYLVIPDSVTEIDVKAFGDCWLEKVYISNPELFQTNYYFLKIVKI